MILVTGGYGMIGSNVVALLRESGQEVQVADLKNGMDLSNLETCLKATRGVEQVFHLADTTVGIEFSSRHHGDMFASSVPIAVNMLRAAQCNGVRRFLLTSSSCVYGDDVALPARESDGHAGAPEKANEGYGWAKRVAELLGQLYSRESEMKIVAVRPGNIYGPSYDWHKGHLHVIPSLIRKMVTRPPAITVMGSGRQTRSFMHERDAARLMILLLEKGQSGEVYNLGGEETSIRDLALLLQKICEYGGNLSFDTSALEGPSRKCQDVSKLKECLGAVPPIPFAEGLKETVAAARKALA